MSKNLRRKQERRKNAYRAALASQSPTERSTSHDSAQLHESNQIPSDREAQKYPTVSENLLWATIAAILGLLATLGWGPAERWYLRPRLEMWIATSILIPHSQAVRETIENNAILYDTHSGCTVVGYRLIANRADSEPFPGSVEVYWKLLLHNAGHSALTNLNFSLDSTKASEVSVDSSPNLIIDPPLHDPDPPGTFQRIATIREIAPGDSGILTVRAFAGTGVLSVRESPNGGGVSYIISDVSVPVELRFEGSSEMKGRDSKFETSSMLDLLHDESRLEGDSNLRIPFVRKTHFTAEGPTNFTFAFIEMTGSQACRKAPENQYMLTWPVTVNPKGERSAPP